MEPPRPRRTIAILGSSSGSSKNVPFHGAITLAVYDFFSPQEYKYDHALPSATDTLLLTPRYTSASSFRVVVNKLIHELLPPVSGYDCISGAFLPRSSHEIFRTSCMFTYRAILVALAEQVQNLETTFSTFEELFNPLSQQYMQDYIPQLQYDIQKLCGELGYHPTEVHKLEVALHQARMAKTIGDRWVAAANLLNPLDHLVELHRTTFSSRIQREMAELSEEIREYIGDDDSAGASSNSGDELPELLPDRHWDYVFECKFDNGQRSSNSNRHNRHSSTTEYRETQHLQPWTSNLLLLARMAWVFRGYLGAADRTEAGKYRAISRIVASEITKARGSVDWVVGMRVPYTNRSRY